MTATVSDVLKDKIGPALGRLPSGVHVVTASDADTRVGMIASWISQAGFEPPMITMAVAPDRELYKVIQKTGLFTVNILSGANMNLMKPFSKYTPEQFDGLNIQETSYGVTLKDTVGVLYCGLRGELNGGDHNIILAEVLDAESLNLDNEPFVHIRKSGFNY